MHTLLGVWGESTWLGTSPWLWLGFGFMVFGLLFLDLWWDRGCHTLRFKDSVRLSLGYFLVAVLFGLWIVHHLGHTSGMHYFTAYFLEKTLSLDNLFVFALIFSRLNIPDRYQRRVLVYGILGMIVLRALMLWLGIALIQQFDGVLVLFAVFLLVVGAKTLWEGSHHKKEKTQKTGRHPLDRWLPVAPLSGPRFFIKTTSWKSQRVRWHVTPLFLALVSVEFADLVFALDSIPAVLTISTDPFVIYTSNIMAVLGLRALYFVLASIRHRLCYVHQGVGIILMAMGGKVMYSHYVAQVPAGISLALTLGVLGVVVLASLWRTRSMQPQPDADGH